MLRTKALRKIFLTTLSMFILLTVFSLPSFQEKQTLRTNLEVDNNITLKTDNIYLLNKNNYLVKSKIFLNGQNLKEKIIELLNNLIIKENNKIPSGLTGTIPKNTKIKEVFITDDLITINFSNDILKVSSQTEKQMLSSIVYSVLDLAASKGISILVDENPLKEYPNSKEKIPLILTKEIGINKEYFLNSRKSISKVVIYYLENIDENLYYVPVTKYLNDDRDKIKIIIEELTTNYIYEPNLMSFLDSKVELIDYKEENNVLFLNFNDYLLDQNDKILEEVIYSISYSVFANYEVNMVMFEVNNKEIKYVSRTEK